MNIEETCLVCARARENHVPRYGMLQCPLPANMGTKLFRPYPRSRATETETLRFALALGRIAAGTCGGDADSIWEEIDALLGVRFACDVRTHWVMP